MHSVLRILSLLLLGLLPTQLSHAGPQDIPNGQAFKKLQNEITSLHADITDLKSQILDMRDPSAKYPYVEQVPLGDGATRTLLYAANEWSYHGKDTSKYFDDSGDPGAEFGEGELINALGEFSYHYAYYYNETESYNVRTPMLPPLFDCPRGGQARPTSGFKTGEPYLVQQTFRNFAGGIVFSNNTPDSGAYFCDGQLYEVLEGRGFGNLSCIQKAYYRGNTTGGYNPDPYNPNRVSSFDQTYGFGPFPGAFAGRLIPETNGLVGTLYLEIIAPDGCIPEK